MVYNQTTKLYLTYIAYSPLNVILRVATSNFNLKLGKSRTLYNSFRVYRNMLLLVVVRCSSM